MRLIVLFLVLANILLGFFASPVEVKPQSKLPLIPYTKNRLDVCEAKLETILEFYKSFEVQFTQYLLDSEAKFANFEKLLKAQQDEVRCKAVLEELQKSQEKLKEVEKQLTHSQAKVALYEKVLNFRNKADLTYHFQRIGNSYYYIGNFERLTWREAVNKCQRLGGHLLSIQNEEELEAVKRHLQYNLYYWVDINDIDKDGVYMSETTGLEADFLKWGSGEPNNFGGSEECVELRSEENHNMNDVPCDNKSNYICETPADFN